jgi:hypothetical protein
MKKFIKIRLDPRSFVARVAALVIMTILDPFPSFEFVLLLDNRANPVLRLVLFLDRLILSAWQSMLHS